MQRGRPSGLAAAAIVLALLSVPFVSAHGAPEARPIDTRIMTDTTDFGDYGAGGALDEGAWDILALDVREARTPTGAHALAFRIIAQTSAESGERSLILSFQAPAGHQNITLTEAGGWTADGGIRMEGPTDVGDGHPKAFDVWIDAAAMGLGPGTELPGLRLTSTLDGSEADIMPGSWRRGGVAVPAPTVPTEPASYTLQGPAPLLDADPMTPDLTVDGPVSVNVTITNTVAYDQFLDLRVEAPDDTKVEGVPASLLVPANGSRALTFTAEAPNGTTRTVRLVASSDLGGWLDLPYTLQDQRPLRTTATPTATEDPDATTPPEGEDAPLVALPLLLGALGALACTGRRRP